MTRWVHSRIPSKVQGGAGTIPSETIPNDKQEGILLDSFYETNIILIQNLAKTQLKKKISGQYP